MEIKTMTHSDGFLTASASLAALIFSQISASITDENFLKWVTAISSVVLCLTAVIKFIDLCSEKLPKVRAYFRRRFGNTPDL
jgi:uncharacterized membrane protein